MTDDPLNTDALGQLNRRIVADGETLPAVTLRDGSRVQTGTVAAMLQHIDAWNRGEREGVEQALALAIPTLFKVGLFDLFAPEEWIAGDNPGRRKLGELALQWRHDQGDGGH